jgi:hypothetical protein
MPLFYDRGYDYWWCNAYEQYGIGHPEQLELRSTDEMKAVLKKYAELP